MLMINTLTLNPENSVASYLMFIYKSRIFLEILLNLNDFFSKLHEFFINALWIGLTIFSTNIYLHWPAFSRQLTLYLVSFQNYKQIVFFRRKCREHWTILLKLTYRDFYCLAIFNRRSARPNLKNRQWTDPQFELTHIAYSLIWTLNGFY